MPILVNHRGVMGAATEAAAPEIFSFGTWWNTVDDPDNAPSQAHMDAIAEAFRASAATMFSDTNLAVCNNVWLTECRSYYYPPQAQAAGDPHPGHFFPATVIGYSDAAATPAPGTEALHVPLQLTVAASLSAAGRLKPRFGRFYLPPLGKLPGADGLMSTADAGHVLDAVTDHLARCDAAFPAVGMVDYQLIIQSRTSPPGGYPRYQPVREVRVGRVIDTQRRRRNALEEAYVGEAYP